MRNADQDMLHMREAARRIFLKGVEAVEPAAAVKRNCRREGDRLRIGESTLDLSTFDRILVVGAGKASAPMAVALEQILGERITRGIVNVKYGYTAPVQRINLVEAGHPVADENGVRGARQILDLITGASHNDLILCLISGGGSALLPLPVESISLADKQATFRVLTDCGATIHEMNTIRKHMSRIKGGHLAMAAHPATVISLMLSDVVGDDLDVIASGPTVPDSTTYRDCFCVLDQYRVRAALPVNVVRHLAAGLAGRIPETPKAGDAVFAKTRNLIVGSNIDAVTAAEQEARRLGYRTLVLSSMIEGETRHVAHVHGAIAKEIKKTGNPIPTPACILSGGETTVTLKGKGLGGRKRQVSGAFLFRLPSNLLGGTLPSGVPAKIDFRKFFGFLQCDIPHQHTNRISGIVVFPMEFNGVLCAEVFYIGFPADGGKKCSVTDFLAWRAEQMQAQC